MTHMNSFYVIRHLGRGSEGSVILAEHKKTQKQVAIKRVEFSSLEEANEKLNEANQLKQLNHKHIIQFKEMFLQKYSVDTSFVCIALEYCPGGDLASLIQRTWKKTGTMAETDIVRLASEIASALDFLHAHGIVHRDLKPQNILLDQDGVVKITDFGIARSFSGESVVRTQCGTPNYMSFQILNGEPYNELTDMYSLGVVIFEMMTGRSIFFNSFDDTKYRKLKEELLLRYDTKLVDLAFSLISFEAHDRPSAKNTVRILREIHRKQRLGMKVPMQERLPAFVQLEDLLKLQVFLFLDVFDISRLIMVCKDFWQLVEKRWWHQFCTKTNMGKEMLSTASPSTSFTIEDYKRRVRSILRKDVTRRKRAVAIMGRHTVHELQPNQMHDASVFLAQTMLQTAPHVCCQLFPHLAAHGDSNATNSSRSRSSGHKMEQSSLVISGGSATKKSKKATVQRVSAPSKVQPKSWPVDEKTFRQMVFMMRCLIRYGIKYGRVYVSSYTSPFDSGTKRIHGISVWGHPVNSKNGISLYKLRRIGFLRAFSELDLQTTRRFLNWMQSEERIHRGMINPKRFPHWRLFVICVSPYHLNKGLGTEILTPVLKIADLQELPIYTHVHVQNKDQRAKWVRFFKRAGFDVMDQNSEGVSVSETGLENQPFSSICCMYRD